MEYEDIDDISYNDDELSEVRRLYMSDDIE